MEIFKLLSVNEIIAQIVSFLVLLFLLRIVAWKKVLAFLDARKEKIQAEFRHIDQAKVEVMQLRAEYEAKLKTIAEEAQRQIQQAADQGKIISEEARKNAQVTAQEIIDNARESIKYELSKAKVEMRNEIIDLTIKATEALIREKLTDIGDRRLVNDFLEGVDKV